jgi:hypothetical protein
MSPFSYRDHVRFADLRKRNGCHASQNKLLNFATLQIKRTIEGEELSRVVV